MPNNRPVTISIPDTHFPVQTVPNNILREAYNDYAARPTVSTPSYQERVIPESVDSVLKRINRSLESSNKQFRERQYRNAQKHDALLTVHRAMKNEYIELKELYAELLHFCVENGYETKT